jgi:hypothetical protein
LGDKSRNSARRILFEQRSGVEGGKDDRWPAEAEEFVVNCLLAGKVGIKGTLAKIKRAGKLAYGSASETVSGEEIERGVKDTAARV